MRVVTANTDPIFGGGDDYAEVQLTKAEVATLRKAAAILTEWSDRMEAEVGTDTWRDGDGDTFDVDTTRYALTHIVASQIR